VADARLRDRREGCCQIEQRFTAKGAKATQRARWMDIEEIGHAVIGAAIKVHSIVGPGLLESAYEACLLYELEKQRVHARTQVIVPIRYEELTIDNGYRIDVLVEDAVVVELKCVSAILPVHRGQLLSYLRLGRFKLGFLLNFQVAHMRDGIVRMVNGL
jgi:GxxExxY protein